MTLEESLKTDKTRTTS